MVLDCCFAQRAHGVTGNVMDSLSATAQEKGFYLLAAAGRDEQAWAPGGERYTSFSGELIRLLRDGDPAGPDVFTLDRVYRELSGRLVEKGFPRPRRQAADQTDQRPLARNAAARPPAPVPQSPTRHRGEEGSPYRGLAFFRREDAEYFFGRDELSRDLVDRVGAHRSRGRPLVVTGPSGAGKSSLLRAGLIAAVERMDGESARWDWHVLTPGADPFRELANRLASSTEGSRDALRVELLEDPGRLAEVVAAKPGRVLLVIDQFEELFTSCPDEAVRQGFVRALTAAAGEAAVVLGVRAGYFGYCRCPRPSPATPAVWSRWRSGRRARSWPPAARTVPCGCGISAPIGAIRSSCPKWSDIPPPCTRPRSMTPAARSVAFSPDGQTLVTASDDRKARLWDVRDPRRPTVLSELSSHVGAVFGVAFGAGGRTVVTAAEDRTAKLWDVTDRARPRLIATLTGHTNAVHGVAFAPDGATIVTASRDSTAQLWYTDANAVADLVCSMLNTRITPAQWAQILPDVPFQAPCP